MAYVPDALVEIADVEVEVVIASPFLMPATETEDAGFAAP
jgi:hypothetical protein